MIRNPRTKAFTLVELLVVVSIILIVGGGIFTLINPAQQLRRSRDARRKADLEAIRQALELYRADNVNKFYAPNLSALSPNYISSVPQDPLGLTPYDYGPTPGPANSTTYDLCTTLEVSGGNYCVQNP